MPSSSTDAVVEREWAALVERCGLSPSAAAESLARLRRLYGEPHRAYHNLDHIADLLRGHRDLDFDRPDAVVAAIFYHDAIYAVGAPDNEARSAALAVEDLDRMGGTRHAARVAELIEATRTHEATGDRDTDLLIDLDMSVLGADAPDYERYRDRVMAEYLTVYDEADYHRGRVARFIDPTLARDRIFITSAYEDREDQARENLRTERDWLLAA